jgi:hypothetical protein
VIWVASHADVVTLLEGAGDDADEPEAPGDEPGDELGDGLGEVVAVGEFVGVGLGVCTATVVGGDVVDVDAALALPDQGRAISSQITAMTTRRMSSTISRRRRYTAFDGRGRGSGVVTVTG